MDNNYNEHATVFVLNFLSICIFINTIIHFELNPMETTTHWETRHPKAYIGQRMNKNHHFIDEKKPHKIAIKTKKKKINRNLS